MAMIAVVRVAIILAIGAAIGAVIGAVSVDFRVGIIGIAVDSFAGLVVVYLYKGEANPRHSPQS